MQRGDAAPQSTASAQQKHKYPQTFSQFILITLTFIIYICNNYPISLKIEADSVCQYDRPSTGVDKESSGREWPFDVADKETTSNHLAIERHLEKQKSLSRRAALRLPGHLQNALSKRPQRAPRATTRV